MKATEMKVTYIDPDMRQLFVEKLPDGGYGVWSQKDKHAPRKLMAASIRKDGYKTFEDAQHALDLYVSNKRHGAWRTVCAIGGGSSGNRVAGQH